MALKQSLVVALTSLGFGSYYSRLWPFEWGSEADRFSCLPFLPRIFVETPPPADNAFIHESTHQLDQYFSKFFAQGQLDSLSIAVVTSAGPIFERNWGTIRGNASTTSRATTSHDSYRIASVSKMFVLMEALVLQQKGVISWDDPVSKYLPEFKYRLDGYSPGPETVSDPQNTPITLLQLASHMSGLGRDWPAGTASDWPETTDGGGPPPENGLPFPTHEELFKDIQKHRLVSPPFAYPSYSNTGIGVLGLALVAANRAASNDPLREPDTWAKLVKRDVFEPLGLNGSHFLATDENSANVVVPSVEPDYADFDFRDAMNPAGGQFASLSDLVSVVQMVLDPSRRPSILTRYSRDQWFQTVHDFDEDQWTAIGLIWEIIKHQDSYGRLHKIYWKLGALAGYQSAVAVHPASSYGVVVLHTGEFADAAKLAYAAFDIMQPAFDKAQAELASSMYCGRWASGDRTSSATIVLEKGTLYATKLVINGTDVLPLFGPSRRVPLRSPERRDEFRLDTGLAYYNRQKHMGCYPYWNGQDIWALRNNAPINLLYFSGHGDERSLHLPASDVQLERV